MIENAQALISDFEAALGAPLATPIFHESQLAPCRGDKLPQGMYAIYVFSLSKNYGDRVPAGRNRALTVGKADCNSNFWFQSQQRNPSSVTSNLASSLLETKIYWPHLGIIEMSGARVRSWIEENIDRDNFCLSEIDASRLGRLEIYLRWRLGPLFSSG